MFAGIYYGGMYGGSTTSILLNTPGESSSVVTAIEGNKMAKAGPGRPGAGHRGHRLVHRRHHRHRAARRVRPDRGEVRRQHRRPDYFAIMLLVAARRHRRARLLAPARLLRPGPGSRHRPGRAGPGLRPAAADLRPGPLLADGIDIVVVAVAIFALGEALWVAAHLRRTAAQIIPVGQPWMGREDWKRSWKPWLRGTAFGFPFGALPAGGAEIPTFLSYITEKRLSKHRRRVRQGGDRGRRRARRRPTTPRPPARSCRCCRWACRPTRRPR